MLIEKIEVYFAGQSYLEALVIAILLGVAVRALWAPGAIWRPGINFSAKTLLEIAVVLLGASLSASTVGRSGRSCCSASRIVVAIASAATHLPRVRAAAAHVHPDRVRQLDLRQLGDRGRCAGDRRDPDDVASSIAFTAVLGVVVVLALPLLVPLLDSR